MVKEFTYEGLLPEFHKRKNIGVQSYMWMHEYCWHYLEDHPEVEMVKLTLDGEGHSEKMAGKEFEFKRQVKPEDVKLRVNTYQALCTS